jgi:hypothetical protein
MSRESETDRDPGYIKLQAFAAACLLTAALLLPHASPLPVLAGMVLAGVIRWVWGRWHERPPAR